MKNICKTRRRFAESSDINEKIDKFIQYFMNYFAKLLDKTEQCAIIIA